LIKQAILSEKDIAKPNQCKTDETAGADIAARSNDGSTPTSCALWEGRQDVVQLLFDNRTFL
jgi:ankyrin repeat protein